MIRKGICSRRAYNVAHFHLKITRPEYSKAKMSMSKLQVLLTPASPGHQRTWDEHDDVMKWKHFPRYWPFVRGIHRSPVNSPHKGQ